MKLTADRSHHSSVLAAIHFTDFYIPGFLVRSIAIVPKVLHLQMSVVTCCIL
jgi:hypothetical protein